MSRLYQNSSLKEVKILTYLIMFRKVFSPLPGKQLLGVLKGVPSISGLTRFPTVHLQLFILLSSRLVTT